MLRSGLPDHLITLTYLLMGKKTDTEGSLSFELGPPSTPTSFDRARMALYQITVALLIAPTAAFNFAARLASAPATSTVSRANVVGRLGFVGGGRAGELGGIEATSYGLDGMYGGYGMGGGMYGGYGRGMYGGMGGGYGGYGMMNRGMGGMYGSMGGYGMGGYGMGRGYGMGGYYGGMGYGGMGGGYGGYGMMNRGMGGMGGMYGGMGGYDNMYERQMYGGNGGRGYMSSNQPGGGMGMYNNVNGMRMMA